MKPLDYLAHLDAQSERSGLPMSDLRPEYGVIVEEHQRCLREASRHSLLPVLRDAFPAQYQNFLQDVGTGVEHGGCAVWLHCDITRPGSVYDVRGALLAEAEYYGDRQAAAALARFVPVLDSRDGLIYGFTCPNGRGWPSDEVCVWDTEERRLAVAAADFECFLAARCAWEERSDERVSGVQLRRAALVCRPGAAVAAR